MMNQNLEIMRKPISQLPHSWEIFFETFHKEDAIKRAK